MHGRATALGFGLLVAWAASAVVVAASACHIDSCDAGWEGFEVIEHDSATDFHAVASVRGSGHAFEYMAAGSNGMIVAWERERNGGRRVLTSTVEPGVTLRGAVESFGNWWVVGDGGLAAFSSDQGRTWTIVDLDTSASLHAITEVGGFLVVVGDEVVRIIGDGATWSQLSPPSEGWGQLRAVSGLPDDRTYAVGLDGVIRATDDVTKSWQAEDSGVDADLFAVEHVTPSFDVTAVGADGTHLVREDGAWIDYGTDTSVDLFDYDRGASLTEEGRVSGVDIGDYEPFVGARALYYDTSAIVVVGDAGLIVVNTQPFCE
jgi:hypothetical protein